MKMESEELNGIGKEDEEGSFQKQNNVLLRNYQTKLINEAEKQNTIIFLPTGSGKTFIALWIIKSRSHEVRKPFSQGGKRTFFLVNTKALVDQQASVVEEMTDLTVGRYTGDMNVDFWKKEKWLEELEKHQVMVMTAQILVNILSPQFITLEQINVIVFDECHHAVHDHPYRVIMKQFENVEKENQPLVLGLSATLLNGNSKNRAEVEKNVNILEATFLGKVAASEELSEVLRFSTNPMENVIPCQDVSRNTTSELVGEIFDEAISFLKFVIFPSDVDENVIQAPENSFRFKKDNSMNKRVKNALEDAVKHFELLGLYGGNIAALYHLIEFEKLRLVTDCPDNSELLTFVITTLNKIRRIICKKLPSYHKDSLNVIREFSAQKLSKLIDILQNHKRDCEKKKANDEKEETMACIIFVERRVTAVVLYHILKTISKENPELAFISADFMVGGSGNPMANTRECLLEQMRTEDVIKKFSSHEINILVATDVVEEGIDLPSCNLVVKFDKPKDYRSYVQSKGRARHKTSKYITLIESKEYSKFEDSLISYKRTQKDLNNLLIGKTDDREVPSEDTIRDSLYSNEIEPYYVSGPGSAYVTGESAIACIERYCQSLPQDYYSLLCPLVWLRKENVVANGQIQDCRTAILQLPIACPLRDNIEGDPMSNSKLAKRSVFLKAVKLLHQRGELSDDLVPRKRIVNVNDHPHLFPHYVHEKIPKDKPQPGTKQRTQIYPIQHAECLSGCLPMPGNVAYLHVISTKPTYNRPTEHRRETIYDLLNSDTTYAILSSKKIPELCQFPIFTTPGQVACNLLVNAATVTLGEEQISKVKKFHFDLFNKLLGLVKSSFVFDTSNEENSFFIVPVNKTSGTYEIIWDIVNKRDSFPEVRTLNDSERAALEITEDKYNLRVVVPFYRVNDTYYLVTKVCKDMSPMTKFPDNFDTYYDYFRVKYNYDIQQKDQFLLEAKALSSSFNFLRPKPVSKTGGIKGKKKRLEEADGFDEHLVPELCICFPFPAGLWLKATLLPSILYRIANICVIEEFRQGLAREAGVGTVNLPRGMSWGPLAVDDSCIKGQDEEYEKSVTSHAPSNLKPSVPDCVKKQTYTGWGNEELPVDIERNLDSVAPCDLVYYVQFAGKKLDLDNKNPRFSISPRMEIQEGDNNVSVVAKNKTTIPFIPLKLIQDKPLNSKMELSELTQAFTTAKANDICSLERLETLGDSFLKFSSALFAFREFKEYDEGKLVSLKDKIVGNKNLLYCARAKGFASNIIVDDFQPKSDWNPPLIKLPVILRDGICSKRLGITTIYDLDLDPEVQLSGLLSRETIKEIREIVENGKEADKSSPMELLLSRKTIPDKTVADCSEALIGVYLKNFGLEGGFKFLNWLGVMPTATYDYLIKEKLQDSYLRETNNKNDLFYHLNPIDYEGLEKTINYKFKEKSFLLEALTHSSYIKNRLTYNYQRLEFLGDAILDFLITCYIYEHCGNLTPGKVTDLRSSLVNNVTFACLAVKYNFHKYLLSLSASLMEPVNRFVKYQITRGHIVDEAVLVLLDESECKLSEAVEVPKILGDIFESLAGAIFLDSGNSLEAVWRVYYPLMKEQIDAFSKSTPKQPIRLLYEALSYKPLMTNIMCPDKISVLYSIEILGSGTPQVFHGVGRNKELAKKSAAKHALKFIMDQKSE